MQRWNEVFSREEVTACGIKEETASLEIRGKRRMKMKEADMQAFGSLQLDFSTWPSFSFPTPLLLLLSHGRSLPADLLLPPSPPPPPPPHPPPPLSPPDPAPSLWSNLCPDFSSAGVPSLTVNLLNFFNLALLW